MSMGCHAGVVNPLRSRIDISISSYSEYYSIISRAFYNRPSKELGKASVMVTDTKLPTNE